MILTQHHAYPVETDTVLAAFLSQEHLEQKYHHLKVIDYKIEHLQTIDGVFCEQSSCTVSPQLPQSIPKIAQKLVRQTVRIHRTVEWVLQDDPVKEGAIKIKIEGMPAEIHGEMVLKPTAEGCVHQMILLIICKIPVIGHKVSKVILKNIRQTLEEDHRFCLQYLKQQA